MQIFPTQCSVFAVMIQKTLKILYHYFKNFKSGRSQFAVSLISKLRKTLDSQKSPIFQSQFTESINHHGLFIPKNSKNLTLDELFPRSNSRAIPKFPFFFKLPY